MYNFVPNLLNIFLKEYTSILKYHSDFTLYPCILSIFIINKKLRFTWLTFIVNKESYNGKTKEPRFAV